MQSAIMWSVIMQCLYAESHKDDCHYFVCLSVVLQSNAVGSAIMLSVIMLSVILQCHFEGRGASQA
jgi:hypothetical protein